MNDPTPSPRDPEQTRGRILDAALDIFARKGYHDASVDEIVDASGSSKGSVYFHFPNKQRLFLALVDKFADVLERNVHESVAKEAAGIGRRVRLPKRGVIPRFERRGRERSGEPER